VSKKAKKVKAVEAEMPEWERDLLAQHPQQAEYVTAPVPVAYPHPTGFHTMNAYRLASANVMADNDATVAHVGYNGSFSDKTGWHDLDFTATGSSKRERGDAYNREIGELLAVARGYEKLAARMKRRANGLIRQQDAINKHHQQIRERRGDAYNLGDFDLNDLLQRFPGARVISPEEFTEKIKDRLFTDSDEPVAAEFPSIEAAFDALRHAAAALADGLNGDED
jgi:hypothetical protein